MARLINLDDAVDAMKKSICGDTYEVDKAIEAIENITPVEAIPIEFIESRIEQLSRIADDEFNNNGGYVNEFDYRMWALKGLLEDWEGYQEQEAYKKKRRMRKNDKAD